MKNTSHNKKRTVHNRRGSMVIDIQRKVTVVAFHILALDVLGVINVRCLLCSYLKIQ